MDEMDLEEYSPLCRSKLLIKQAIENIRESLGGKGTTVKLEVDRAPDKEDDTSKKREKEQLKQLEEYFNILEEDRRNLQNLLQEQKEEQEMELRALEREIIQERLEWERESREREEALLSFFITLATVRQKTMKDLRLNTNTLSSIALCDSEASGHAVIAFQSDLQQITQLEKRVRRAETLKLQKATAKAEKKAEKMAKKEKKKGIKEGKKLEAIDDNNNLLGCAVQNSVTSADQERRDIKKRCGFFRKMSCIWSQTSN